MIPLALLLSWAAVSLPWTPAPVPRADPPAPATAGAAADPSRTVASPSPELAERRRALRRQRLEREYRRHVSRRIAREGSPRPDELATWLRERAETLVVDPTELLPSVLLRMDSDDRVDRWCRAGLVELGTPSPPTLSQLGDVLESLPIHPRNPAAGDFVERCRRLGGASPRLDPRRHPRLARRLRRLASARTDVERELRVVEAVRDAIRTALSGMATDVAPAALAVFDVREVESRLRRGWSLRRAKRTLRSSLERAAHEAPRWRNDVALALAQVPVAATAELLSIHEGPEGSMQLEISRVAVSKGELESWASLLPPSHARR